MVPLGYIISSHLIFIIAMSFAKKMSVFTKMNRRQKIIKQIKQLSFFFFFLETQ